jgi:hypothetical protein
MVTVAHCAIKALEEAFFLKRRSNVHPSPSRYHNSENTTLIGPSYC